MFQNTTCERHHRASPSQVSSLRIGQVTLSCIKYSVSKHPEMPRATSSLMPDGGIRTCWHFPEFQGDPDPGQQGSHRKPFHPRKPFHLHLQPRPHRNHWKHPLTTNMVFWLSFWWFSWDRYCGFVVKSRCNFLSYCMEYKGTTLLFCMATHIIRSKLRKWRRMMV